MQYTECSWFVFSLDGAGFLAFDPPESEFWTKELPKHLLKDQYYLLFLLVQQQRLFLMDLSEEVAGYEETHDENPQDPVFEHLRNRLMDFTSKGLFQQVMQREHHHRVYRKWRSKLEIADLYKEVSDEIKEIHQRMLLRIQKRREVQAEQLQDIIFMIAPASLAMGLAQTIGGLLSTPVPTPSHAWSFAMRIGGGALLMGLGLGIILMRLSPKIQRLIQRFKR